MSIEEAEQIIYILQQANMWIDLRLIMMVI